MPDPAKSLPALAGILLLLSACDAMGEAGAEDRSPLAYNGAASVSRPEENPDRLMGLDIDAIHELLGEPALVRRDGDAEVWQYRAEYCVLDLFMYGDVKQVEHVDLRDRGEGPADSVRACFAAMLTGKIPAE